jgi:hypothetical protein
MYCKNTLRSIFTQEFQLNVVIAHTSYLAAIFTNMQHNETREENCLPAVYTGKQKNWHVNTVVRKPYLQHGEVQLHSLHASKAN